MVVRGLQEFALTKPLGCRKVDMLTEIQNWIREYKKCVLVFTITGIMACVQFQNKNEAGCGHRYWVILRQLETFFKQLRINCAQMIFFDDFTPLSTEENSIAYKNWRHTKRKDAMEIFYKKLDQGVPLAQTGLENYFKHFAHAIEIEPILELCQKYAHDEVVNTSYDLDCNLVSAKYANEHNALAVLAEDSDFLIFSGDWQYWDTRTLKLDTLEINEISRSQLTRTLRLHQEEMAVLATISTYRFAGFEEMAICIRNNELDDAHFAEQLTESKQKILYRYNLERPWVNPKGTPLYQSARGIREIYHIMSETPQTFYAELWDPRIYYYLMKLWQPLYQRQMGIVLRQGATRRILTSFATLDAIFPSFEVPTIGELLDSDSIHLMFRNRILAWMVTGEEFFRNYELAKIAQVEPGYLTVVITLWYLVKSGIFTAEQADRILTVEAAVRLNHIPMELSPPAYIRSEDLKSVKMYTQMHKYLRSCLIICGLPIENETLKFDSVFFYDPNFDSSNVVKEKVNKLRTLYAK